MAKRPLPGPDPRDELIAVLVDALKLAAPIALGESQHPIGESERRILLAALAAATGLPESRTKEPSNG